MLGLWAQTFGCLPRIAESAERANSVQPGEARRDVREMATADGKDVGLFRTIALRERVVWADAAAKQTSYVAAFQKVLP